MDAPLCRQNADSQHYVFRESILSWLSRTDECESGWSICYSPSSRSSVMSSSKASGISSLKSSALSSTKQYNIPLAIVIPSRGGSSGDRAPNSLSDKNLDLWEHASVLYHGYAWQDAAENFYEISLTTDNAADRAVCLLSAGLIEARLGDYEIASETLDDAAYLDDSLLIISFVRGLVSARLGDYGVADGHFEACLDNLEHDAVGHSDIGLDFVLDRPMLQRNLKAIRFAMFDASERRNPMPPHLDGIPAEIICEPPPRATPTSKSPGRSSERASMLRKMFKGKAIDTSCSPSVGAPSRFYSNRYSALPESPLSPRSPTSPLAMYHRRQSDISENSPPTTSPTNRPFKKPSEDILSSSTPSVAWKRYSSEWRTRPRTPYVPRNARVEQGSTQPLANFLSGAEDNQTESKPCLPYLAKDGQQKMIPRNARGEHSPTEELATFVKVYAPESSRPASLVRPLVHVDPEIFPHLPLNRTFGYNEEPSAWTMSPNRLRNEVDPVVGPSNTPPGRTLPPIPPKTPELAPTNESNNGGVHKYPQIESAHNVVFATPPQDTEQMVVGDPPLELLQPVAYQPKRPRQTNVLPQVREGSTEELAITSDRYGQHRHDLVTPLFTPSSNQSFCRSIDTDDRKVLAEKRALARLEGRDPPKQSQIENDGGGSLSNTHPSRSRQRDVSPPDSTLNSTIESVDFFETIVNSKKSKKR